MKLQRTTLILLLIALGLGGFVYVYEIQGKTQREVVKDKQKKIFSFEKEQIQAFTIKDQQQTLQFERANQTTGNNSGLLEWQIKTPNQATANDASVSFLLNLLVNAKSNSSFAATKDKLSEYGLDRPQAILEVKLKNNETHQIILGKSNFDRTLLYAQANPAQQNNQQLDVMLVSMDFQYALKRPLSEWTAKQENPSNTSSPNPEKPVPKKSEQANPSPTSGKSPLKKQDTTVNPAPTPEKSTPKKQDTKISPAPTPEKSPPKKQGTKITPAPTPEKSTPKKQDTTVIPSPTPKKVEDR